MKEDLCIVNHTRRVVYTIGRVRRKDDRPIIIPRNIEDINYELSYDVLTRLMLAVKDDEFNILLDEDIADELLGEYKILSSRYLVENIDTILSIDPIWDSLDGE